MLKLILSVWSTCILWILLCCQLSNWKLRYSRWIWVSWNCGIYEFILSNVFVIWSFTDVPICNFEVVLMPSFVHLETLRLVCTYSLLHVAGIIGIWYITKQNNNFQCYCRLLWKKLNQYITRFLFLIKFNPLTPELPQHVVPRPRAPRHNIIFNSFFFEISKPIFRLCGNKSKTCRSVFLPYGNS